MNREFILRLKGLRRAAVIGLASLLLGVFSGAAYADDVPEINPALVNKDIVVTYTPPTTSYFNPIYEKLKQRKFLEQLKAFLSPLNIPSGITLKINVRECGQVNSWWTGRATGLKLCYEWMDFGIRNAPLSDMPDGMTREDAILGSFLQVTFHELGHAMFDIYDVPILGREEDAADQMAGFILAQFGPEIAKRMFPGTVYVWQQMAKTDGPYYDRLHDFYSDVHGHPLQRAFNYLCMAYGSQPDVFQYTVDSGLLPKARAENCGREVAQIRHAFAATIYPHIDQTKMKIVQSSQWLLPEGQEIPPK